MQEREEKEHGLAQAETEDEQVIRSNQLLKAIRERMANREKRERAEETEESE